jgi:hypothetical protein
LLSIGAIIGLVSYFIVREGPFLGLVVTVPVYLFMVYIFFNTWYEINGNRLTIHSGFLYHQEIEIRSITNLRATNNPLSAPAASFDRLELRYLNNRTVLISPKDKSGFIEELRKIHPEIEVKV